MTVFVEALDLPAWNPLDTPIDKVLFEGRFFTPGYAEIVGASAQRKWEEFSGSGWSGGVLLFRGWPLAHFVIRMTLYEARDWDDWNVFRPLVTRLPGGKFPKALTVSHPMLAQLGITAVVIEAVRAPDQIDHGVWQIDLDCIERRALHAGGATIADETPDEVDPVEQNIIKPLRERVQKAQDEYNALANSGNLP